MRKFFAISLAGFALSTLPAGVVCGQARGIVPGTGVEVAKVGDDFEDPTWTYIPNNPKSTEDIDKNQHQPVGRSSNGRWYEGVKRGHPDIVRRVETPPGGLPGSEGAMLMQSLYTGIPNHPSGVMHQEDFICNVQNRLGGPMSVAVAHSYNTRLLAAH